ncbi:C6 finger domain-containing protein [Colletotrichum asianum]
MSTVFHVTVHVRPRDVARFLEAAEPTIERMKREPELMHFEMYQVHDSPGTITWIEKWSEPVDWIMKKQRPNFGVSRMSDYPIRPPTPQAMLHRLPDKPETELQENTKPSKYIILITASTSVAGKAQIAKSVAAALSCPLFQGDSLHETSAKAATVGMSRGLSRADGDDEAFRPNEARYERMWLSKMTRTGLLFPEESRPANEGFSGFGGTSSTSTSRRGSFSSIASATSDAASTSSIARSFMSSGPPTTKYVNKPVISTPLGDETGRKSNPALMVVTHPELEQWHKDSIRKTVEEYGIGLLFVPLYEEEEELPVLKPLDPRAMTSFGSVPRPKAAHGYLGEETVLRVDIEAKVEEITQEIMENAREIMEV